MRIKSQAQDFIVIEQADLPLSNSGQYAIYRLQKQGITTLMAQTKIAANLGRRQQDVQAPALKDKKAVATQYLSVKGGGPNQIEGDGFSAELVGRSQRPLRPSDLTGNLFKLVIRDLSPDQAKRIRQRMAQVRRWGLPNYFDQQRFGSYNPQHGFIGKTILQRDAEDSILAYFTRPFVGDPLQVREFKKTAAERWGDWDHLMAVAPRPSNFRSLLTYLRDHPTGYRKALNLIPRRLLSIYLVAYQSYLWNRIAAVYLEKLLADTPRFDIELLDQPHPIYQQLTPSLHGQISDLYIALPQHRATYPAEIAPIVQRLLDAEGFKMNDLKPRILTKAYLPKSKRALLLFPDDITPVQILPDELFPGKQAASVAYSLPSGSYATLVLKSLDKRQEIEKT